jgi:hypothetical protein
LKKSQTILSDEVIQLAAPLKPSRPGLEGISSKPPAAPGVIHIKPLRGFEKIAEDIK